MLLASLVWDVAESLLGLGIQICSNRYLDRTSCFDFSEIIITTERRIGSAYKLLQYLHYFCIFQPLCINRLIEHSLRRLVSWAAHGCVKHISSLFDYGTFIDKSKQHHWDTRLFVNKAITSARALICPLIYGIFGPVQLIQRNFLKPSYFKICN